MAKGYWIGRVDVKNEEGYKPYAAANPAIFKKFGGRFLVRGGKFDVAEGNSRTRNVVIEFPDYASALALSLTRISGKHQGAPAALHNRTGRHRGLRRAPTLRAGRGYAPSPLPDALVSRRNWTP